MINHIVRVASPFHFVHVQFEKVPYLAYHINIGFLLRIMHSHLPVGMAVSVFQR